MPVVRYTDFSRLMPRRYGHDCTRCSDRSGKTNGLHERVFIERGIPQVGPELLDR